MGSETVVMTAGAGELLRRTTIELGPLRVTREYRWTPGHAYYPSVDPPRARRRGGWAAAGVLGTLFALSAGGLAVAGTKVAAPPRYSVSVVVPERPVPAAPKPARRVARAAPRVTPAVVAEPDADRADAPPADTGSRAAAVAVALRTGDMQQWYEADGDVRGFVVAGPAEQVGAQQCRALSVLTRIAGGTDRVDQRRECVPAVTG